MDKILSFLSRSLVIWVIMLVLVIFASNYIFDIFNFRFDATFDRRYSFSKGTKSLLTKLEDPIDIRFYHSVSNKETPIGIKNFGQRVENLLQEFARGSRGKIKLFTYDPQPDSDEEQSAVQSGLIANRLGLSSYFLGATVSSGEKEIVIEVFDPARERFLEYDIARTLYNISVDQKNTIGILSSVKLFGSPANPYQPAAPPGFFISELERVFEVRELDYSSTFSIPSEIQTLILFHPQNLKTNVEYAVDQFLMRGGSLVVIFDPYMRNDPSLLAAQRQGQRGNISSSIPKRLFDKWGVRYENEGVLGDRNFAALVQSGQGQFPYALWFNGDQAALNQETAISAGIKEILFVEPGAFRFDATAGLRLIKIVESSENTGFVNMFAVAYSDVEKLNSNMQDGKGRWNLMGILDGDFESAFAQSPPLSQEDAENQDFLAKFNNLPAHKERTEQSGRVLIIADADFLMDAVVVSRLQFFNQVINQPRNDNLSLFFAALTDLQGSEDLALIKPQSAGSRPFELFINMQRKAQAKYTASEKALEARLEEVESSLKQLEPVAGSSQINIPPETAAKIKEYQQLEFETKKQLREIRKLLREDIELFQNILIVINLLLVPAIMTFVGVRIYLKRMQRIY